MKQSVITITLPLVLFLVSCFFSSPTPYTNTPVTNTYTFRDTPALTLTASYPYFEDETYAPLNTAIAQEVAVWRAIYDKMLAQVQEECEKDSVFAFLRRYVEVYYTVESTKDDVSVTFNVQYFGGGNTEPSYTKTFSMDLESRMVYETFTQTKRVYT